MDTSSFKTTDDIAAGEAFEDYAAVRILAALVSSEKTAKANHPELGNIASFAALAYQYAIGLREQRDRQRAKPGR